MEDLTVPAEAVGLRLDRWLAERTGRSRAEIQRLIREGKALVNGSQAKPGYPLRVGDRVQIELPPPGPLAPQPELLPLRIIFEDEEIIVVDKPAGMVTHPGAGHLSGTLVNALLYHCHLAETDDPRRPGLVQRLDRETSGVLVAAKSEEAHRKLVEQFKRGSVRKRYLALVQGIIEEDEGLIELPLGRDARRREEVRVSAGGKRASTEFVVLQRFKAEQKTLVEARPRTGRMHQIRVHFRHIGHPVVGDRKYGRRQDDAPRMMLHAWEIELAHPRTGERVKFSAPPPAEFSPWLAGGGAEDSLAPQDRRGRSLGR
ncbi:MAG: RluA family pseudouridine synthase [Candidatus Acetothermia bacterium]|jgi:23S rRNA pseudouridine1911/1915/1917 synthase|nr:RluA family pseudouridine synthase [Candidatus Acetothermia bacterium]MDH7504617.1 RluA family pseudouridine synthase [Candidatus Acetothermia bacterium]